MRRYVFPALAAVILIGASLFPDDAFARRGGGGGYAAGGRGGDGTATAIANAPTDAADGNGSSAQATAGVREVVCTAAAIGRSNTCWSLERDA